MSRQRVKLTREDMTVNTAATVVCVLMLLATVYPIYYILINSLNEGLDAQRGGLYLFPRKPTLENYAIVFKEKTLVLAFTMTILRTVIGTTLAVTFTSMVAYGLSKQNLMFRKTYHLIGIVSMYFSGGLIPTFLLYKYLGLLDTFSVYVIPTMFSYFHALLFIAYFRTIPTSLGESARMDGASEIGIYLRIIMPLSVPVLATIALFSGVGHWNDWFFPAFFVTKERLMTLPTLLMRLMSLTDATNKIQEHLRGVENRTLTMEGVRFATLIVSVLPITLVYPFLQRYFVKGMMLGSVKG